MGERKLTVMVDLDNVIGLTNYKLIEVLQELKLCPEHVREEDMMHHHLEAAFPEVLQSDIDILFNNRLFWSSIYPTSYMQIALRSLSRSGHKIVIVTDRGLFPEAIKATEPWLQANCYHYHNVQYVKAADKAQWCVDYGADLAIEDRGDTAMSIAEQGIPVLLVKMRYNQKDVIGKLPNRVIRAKRHTCSELLQALAGGERLEALFGNKNVREVSDVGDE